MSAILEITCWSSSGQVSVIKTSKMRNMNALVSIFLGMMTIALVPVGHQGLWHHCHYTSDACGLAWLMVLTFTGCGKRSCCSHGAASTMPVVGRARRPGAERMEHLWPGCTSFPMVYWLRCIFRPASC